MSITKIYLHWTATPYNWVQPNHYHTIITGDGTVHKLHSYQDDLYTHTYRRNYNSIGLSISCMGGKRPWKDYPPTEEQIENLCKETAQACKELNYTLKDINEKNILTHAEAAALRDYSKELVKNHGNISLNHALQYGLPHDNYGPQYWFDGWPGGTAERWDLWQLKPTDQKGIGGYLLRKKIKSYFLLLEEEQINTDNDRKKIKEYLKYWCEKYNLSYIDILAQAIVESNLNPNAVSKSNALGVGQIKLNTAQYICQRHKLPVPKKESDLLGMKNAKYNCQIMCLFMKDLLEKAKEKHLYDTARILYHDGEYAMELGKLGQWSGHYNNKVVLKKKEIGKYL